MYYFCDFEACPSEFCTLQALELHKDAEKHRSFLCPYCDKVCTTKQGLKSHQAAKEHYYKKQWDCGICYKKFGTSSGRSMHITAVHGDYVCPVYGCSKRFKSSNGLEAHQECKGHFKRNSRQQRSKSPEALNLHRNMAGRSSKSAVAIDDYGEIMCVDCDTAFSYYGFQEHTDEACRKVRNRKLFCEPCDRYFNSDSSLQQHMNSLVHKPLSKNLVCVGGCGHKFLAPSSMVMHLESGNCTGEKGKQLNKSVIDNAVFSHDKASVICHGINGTIPTLSAPKDTFIEPDSVPSTPSGIFLTPETSDSGSNSGCATPSSITSALVKLNLSGNPLCCPQCLPFSPPFINKRALEQHLRSVVHSPKIYHCPKALLPKGVKISHEGLEFVSLSGFLQHLEAGACPGRKKGGDKYCKGMLKSAVEIMESTIKAMGLGEAKLLSE